MTTLYIEEISDNENDACSDHTSNGMDTEDPIALASETLNTSTIYESKKAAPNKWLCSEHTACPFTVGGGSTLTNVRGRLYTFGGCDRQGNPSSRLLCYDSETDKWISDLEPEGISPSARFGHSAVASGSKIYIFGGQGFAHNDKNCNSHTPHVCFNDLYCLDTEKMAWTTLCNGETALREKTKSVAIPSCRNSHASALIGDEVIIFGGANADEGPMDDMWVFNLLSESWKKIETNRSVHPEAREMHSVCIANSKMYVWGGRKESGEVCQDIWECDPASGFRWTCLANLPSPRCSQGGDYLSSSQSICFFGGWDGMGRVFDELAVLDLSQRKWEGAELHGHLPVERFGHASCAIGDCLYFLGGVNASDDLNELVSVRPMIPS